MNPRNQLALNLHPEINSMTPTQTVALTRAIAFLAATGLPYAIKMPDGTVHGILIVAPEKTKTARKRVNDYAGPTGYPEILATLAPGQSHTFEAESELMAPGLRGVISASGVRLWGKGNVITCITGRSVEILRVE